MSLVTFKDLIIDAVDARAEALFWAERLGLRVDRVEDDWYLLRGEQPDQSVWIVPVPEPKTVKNRVHLDVRDGSLDALADAPHLSEPGEFAWTVLADPEGQEFCVFVTEGASPAFKDLVVDAVDPAAISRWWCDVLGGRVTDDPSGYSHLDDVPGFPGDSFDFVPVPEPKTVKNRVHWDVKLRSGTTIDDLVQRGASVIRTPTAGDSWTVMADPEGNEFCVFDHDRVGTWPST